MLTHPPAVRIQGFTVKCEKGVAHVTKRGRVLINGQSVKFRVRHAPTEGRGLMAMADCIEISASEIGRVFTQ